MSKVSNKQDNTEKISPKVPYKNGQIMFIMESFWSPSTRREPGNSSPESLLWYSLRDGRFGEKKRNKTIVAVIESQLSNVFDATLPTPPWYILCRMFPYSTAPFQPHHFDCCESQIISVFEICCCFFSQEGKYSCSVDLNCDCISHILKFLYPENSLLDKFLYKFIKSIIDSNYSKEGILNKSPCKFVPDYFSNLRLTW